MEKGFFQKPTTTTVKGNTQGQERVVTAPK